VPLSLLKECLLTGTSGDIIEQVAEWRVHGLEYPIIGNFSSVQPNLQRGLATNLPFAKILRGLRKL
jgi:phthiodiolone/phenolphthiodiolone dimycocerosates ketoreductase